jgi:hypothetical protein
MNQLSFVRYDNNLRPGGPAGQISFSDRVSLVRTADGAMLRLGYIMALSSDLEISISGITGEIGFVTKHSLLALGVAVDPRCHVIHTGYKFPIGLAESTISGYLLLPLSLAALEAMERLREGGQPKFTIILHGSVFVRDEQTKLYDACRLQVDGSSDFPVQLTLDRDNWIQQMRNVSPMGSVLVEIPLAVTREAPWDRVWTRLDAASAHLAQGGENGCKTCVGEIRQALDAWRNIDDFRRPPADKEKDKQQRLHDIANALFHYCSLSVHADEHQSDWTRADAILAVATLSALLSVRNP